MKMRLWPEKPWRLLILVGLFLVVLGGEWMYRRWQPTCQITTEHYAIRSSATQEQTEEIGAVVEALYAAYVNARLASNENPQPHLPLQLKLFKDRREFRRCHRRVGWAEAFYRKPYCHAYYSAAELNPYHWMLHEAVHQLNREVSRLEAPQWIEEGLAEYFSTSRLQDGQLHPGQIDRNTYPIWWLDDMDLSGELERDLADLEIIPLVAIISGRGGPKLDDHFNLYYVHWWSLTHFLFHFEGGKYREPFFRVIREGGTQDSFEKHIGPLPAVQAAWYRHLQEQRTALKNVPVKRTKPSKYSQATPRPDGAVLALSLL
jgi:hypothetical protein